MLPHGLNNGKADSGAQEWSQKTQKTESTEKAEGTETMNQRHRAIRTLLTSMAPKRAEEYIQSFALQKEEELYLIEHDVRGKSYAMIADEYHTTPEVIKARRRKAFAKIDDWIQNA